MPEFEGYTEANQYQLQEWVEGRPWHNPWAPDGSYGTAMRDGECCPDFSCCGGELVSRGDRLGFVIAQEAERKRMSMNFLRRWINGVNQRIRKLEESNGGDS